MDSKKTLKQQFQSMNTGLTIVTEVDRATAFVNAKRAGITITTKEIDGKLHVTKTGDVTASSKPGTTVLDQVREITTADRLALFENFELCCGMNRGDCICEPETLQASQIAEPAIDTKSKLERAREALASVEARASTPIERDEWAGWSEPRQTYDDQAGEMRTYRQHIKTGKVKWIDSESYLAGIG